MRFFHCNQKLNYVHIVPQTCAKYTEETFLMYVLRLAKEKKKKELHDSCR